MEKRKKKIGNHFSCFAVLFVNFKLNFNFIIATYPKFGEKNQCLFFTRIFYGLFYN